MTSLIFKNAYIKDYYVVAGPMEAASKLKKYDENITDYYDAEKTFEKAEIALQAKSITGLLKKTNLHEEEIDTLISGDLLNQICVSSYAAKRFNISFLGVYAACSTFTEELLVSASFLNNGLKNIICTTSSHNLCAERQFRYPIEYGSPRKMTSTYTTTGAVSALVTKDTGKIKIVSATIGKVIDMDIKDINNFGAIMAPAAAETLIDHLKNTKEAIDDYDLILTGDLGCVGFKIFKEYLLKSYNLKLNKYLDAGCELYLDSQNTFAGGSGPACLPLVLFGKILENNKYKKILLLATGALHSPTFANQKNGIPAISHAISLEVL